MNLLCLVMMVTLLSVQAQGQPIGTASSTREVHIAVQVRDLAGDPIGHIEPREITVTPISTMSSNPLNVKIASPIPANGQKVAVIPTRLLVILLTNNVETRRSLPEQLRPVWNAGWKISVQDAGGEQSLYLSSASELQTALNGLQPTKYSMDTAIRDLARFAGRRVVFLVTDFGVTISKSTLKKVLRTGVTAYHIGGDPWKQVVATGYTDAGAPPPGNSENASTQTTIFPATPQYQRRRGRQTEEASFQAAERDALRDAEGYYDLTVEMLVETTSLKLKVDTKNRTGTQYYVYAEPYTNNGTHPPSITVANQLH